MHDDGDVHVIKKYHVVGIRMYMVCSVKTYMKVMWNKRHIRKKLLKKPLLSSLMYNLNQHKICQNTKFETFLLVFFFFFIIILLSSFIFWHLPTYYYTIRCLLFLTCYVDFFPVFHTQLGILHKVIS